MAHGPLPCRRAENLFCSCLVLSLSLSTLDIVVLRIVVEDALLPPCCEGFVKDQARKIGGAYLDCPPVRSIVCRG